MTLGAGASCYIAWRAALGVMLAPQPRVTRYANQPFMNFFSKMGSCCAEVLEKCQICPLPHDSGLGFIARVIDP